MAATLDEFLPDAPHRTRYATTVGTDPDATWAAMRRVTVGEMGLTRILIAIRSLSLRALQPDGEVGRPLLDRFLQRGFTVLHEDEPQTLAIGTTGRPWRLRGGELSAPADVHDFAAYDQPGHVRIAMSFELAPAGAGRTRLATETRISPTDDEAARTFGRYWAVVRPGSDIIRLDLLRAVRHRAESW